MSRAHSIISALIAGLLLTGCGAAMVGQGPGAMVRGSGPIIREERPVAGVSAVEFGAFGTLEIVQGDEEGLTIQGQGNILPMVVSKVEGDTLRIYVDGNMQPTTGLQMRLKLRELRSIVAGGSGNITASGVTGDAISVSVTGGNVVTLAGSVREQTITLSGSGSYDGGALESQRASVTIDGFANALVRVSEQLITTISGAGSVEYFGEPRLIDKSAGLGQVMRRTVDDGVTR